MDNLRLPPVVIKACCYTLTIDWALLEISLSYSYLLFLVVISASSIHNKASMWCDCKDIGVNEGGISFSKYKYLTRKIDNISYNTNIAQFPCIAP